MKNTKKKGFTLIELIAVIAILAILGAILVPRIGGYQAKARKSNIQTTAKQMVHAIQAYNAGKPERASGAALTQGVTIINGDDIATAIGIVNGETGAIIIPTTGADYTSITTASTHTVSDLVEMANGQFSLTGTGTISMTNSVTGNIED